MEVEGILGILTLIMAVSAGFVWLIKTVVKRQEKHLVFLSQVAHELVLRKIQPAGEWVRFEGMVNGVPIRLRAYTVKRVRSTDLVTEVRSPLPGGAPGGLCIRRTGIRQRLVATIGGSEKDGQLLLSDPSIAEPCRQLTESLWSGMAGIGEVDENGIRLTKGGSISDPAIIREMVQRVVSTAQALDKVRKT
jgi:hypothetical protein